MPFSANFESTFSKERGFLQDKNLNHIRDYKNI
jgi:hypothetical protein